MASLSNINGIFDVHSTGAIQFNGNHGTAGQILKSNGNAAPTWIPQSDIVGAYLPLAGGTLTGATATASGISFTVGGTLSGSTANFSGFTTSATGFGINYVSGGTVPMVILANATTYGIFYREASPDHIEFKHGGTVRQSFDGNGNVSITGDFTVSGGDITLGGTGRIQGVDTVTDSTDAANKAYVDAHPGSGGTVTSVATGNGLTGGTITSTGTLTMSGDYTGNLSITGANLAGTSYSDPDIVLSITDEDTTASIRNKMTGSSAITKVSDATAPAPGCFQVNGSYYPQGFGPYYKISEGDEFIFEFWIRYVSGAATYNLLYAGSNFYNAAGTYLGNSQRYWGESALNINANTGTGWYHVSGTLGPNRASGNGNIPTTAESMRLLFLFNYNPNGSIVTNYCGLKVYKSNPTVTKLYRKTLGSEASSSGRNRDLVIDSDGDIFGKDITATNIVTATGGNSTQWNSAYANRVTSVATGSGLTGGTITSTGTLTVDSTVIRTTGTQSITGNTTFYPSSTSTSYQYAAIELMASSSGTSGTPPRIAWHWGGVVASSITIEANGTIAVRNNPGNAYEQFKASIITATSNFSGNLTGNVTGNVTGSSGSCTGNSATATLATTATGANGVVITGYGNSTFSFYQSSGSFSGFSGWHNYYIGNHGNGSNYYNTIIAFPFWGPPRYSRLEGNVQRGPYNFLTDEQNYTTDYYIQSNASLRAPIFYDTNTAYYGDFASTSVLNALQFNYTQHGSANNIRMGNSSTMNAISSGTNNVALGVEALGACSTGSRNFATGYAALYSLSSGGSNIAMGDATGYNVTSGSNNLLFGQNAGRTGFQSPQSIAGITSGSNQIHMGNESHSTARIQISWTVNSDKRDKTDITPINVGLDFVKQLNPVTYRWDKRSDYEDRTPTGENKLEELTLGFLAQEVEEVEKSYGYDVATKTNLVVDRDVEQDHYGITYEKMIPILTKAIQELEARVKELENK